MMEEPATAGPASVIVDTAFGPVRAFDNDHVTRHLREFGAHTRNELAMLRAFVDPGDLVFDIGAHIGTFTLPLAASVGRWGRVIAAEADAASFALLQSNVVAHGLGDRVTAINAVIGGGDGAYRAETEPNHTSATWFVADPAGRRMTGTGIDDLHDRLARGRRAAIIKIDVEGMELAVLCSGARTIAADRPILQVEIVADHLARYGDTPQALENWLRALDYRFFRNTVPRNSGNDLYRPVEIPNLAVGVRFFDVLAIPSGSPRLARALG